MFFNKCTLFATITPLACALPHVSNSAKTDHPTCLDSVLALPNVAPLTSLCADKNVMHSAIETSCLKSETKAAISMLESLCTGYSAGTDTGQAKGIQHRDLLSNPLGVGTSLPDDTTGSSAAEPATKSSSPLDGIVSAVDQASVVQGVESGIKTAPVPLKSLESEVESAPLVGDVVSMVKPALDGVATAVSDAPKALGGVVTAAADAPKALGGVVSAVAAAPKELGSVVGEVMATPTSTQHKHTPSEISHPTASLASATRSIPAAHAVPTSALSRSGFQKATGTAPNAPLLTAPGSPPVPKNGTVAKPTLVPTTIIMHDGGQVTVTATGATATAAGSHNRAQATGAAIAVVAGLALLL